MERTYLSSKEMIIRIIQRLSLISIITVLIIAFSFSLAFADDPPITAQGNDVSTAWRINTNTTRTGVITDQWNESHWYVFTVDKSGEFSVEFDGDYASRGSWDVELRDKDKNEVCAGSYSADTMNAKTIMKTGISAGTYYLRVRASLSGLNGLTYRMTPKFSANPLWEAEFNDTIADANSISLDKDHYGTMREGQDKDWSRLVLPADGRLDIVFDGEYVNYNARWYVSLRNKENKKIYDAEYKVTNTTPQTIITMGLPADTYYIQITTSTFAYMDGVTYKMTPKFTASSQWETEFNDSLVDADPISLGAKRYGTLCSGTDKDWSKLTITSKGKYEVKFKGEYTGENASRWDVSLRDKDNKVASKGSFKASTVNEESILTTELSPGTYYLCVEHGGVYPPTDRIYEMTVKEVKEGNGGNGGNGGTGGSGGTGGTGGTGGGGGDTPVPEPVTKVSMHRLYNPNSGEHFYTASEGERDHLVDVGWSYEGIGWTAPESSNTPVYRMYNANGGEHHYTMSEGERDHLVDVGWSYEGVGWYSDDQQRVPLFRDYNPNAFANNHNYTTSQAEHDMLMGVGWSSEGYAWYGM